MNRAVIESSEAYNAAEGHRATSLSVILESAKQYKYEIIDGNRKKETPALRFGSIAHTAILERDKFLERFLIEPEFKGTGSKKAKEDWRATVPAGAIVLDAEEMEIIAGMIRSLTEYEPAFSLLKKGVPEVSLYWTDEESGLPCKARPDYITEDGWIVNLKTARDASYRKFRWAIRDYSYHIQAAHYSAGYRAVYGKEPLGYVMLPIEKVAPYECAVYVADQFTMEKGEMDVKKALARYKQCVAENLWPGIQEEAQNISLPDDMMYE
jgi:exodeoxyribonuclease VIII